MRSSRLKVKRRLRRKLGIRKRIRGTGGKPRLAVFRSLHNIYAQIINDDLGVTLCEASTQSRGLRDGIAGGGNAAAAKVVGTALAQRAKEKSIETVCFDRSGYRYHGRVKALAEAVREGGLIF